MSCGAALRQVRKAGSSPCAASPALREVGLCDCIEDKFDIALELKQLSEISTLSALCLSGCFALKDAEFAPLSAMTALRSLNVACRTSQRRGPPS